jgi:hypothetical protein
MAAGFEPSGFSRQRSWSASLASILLLAGTLTACTSSGTPTPEAAATAEAPTIAAAELVGSWGLASYREEKDIARTETEAKAACNNPYVIGPGTAGGVQMHLADQAQPSELIVKRVDGRNFIGPPTTPAGGPQDREITSFTPDRFVTKWVDPSVANRYGIMIYARCGSAAA